MLVNTDVDALCAARIVQVSCNSIVLLNLIVTYFLSWIFLSTQCLFTWDSVIHTIVPIQGKEDLETAYIEHIEGVGTIFQLTGQSTLFPAVLYLESSLTSTSI